VKRKEWTGSYAMYTGAKKGKDVDTKRDQQEGVDGRLSTRNRSKRNQVETHSKKGNPEGEVPPSPIEGNKKSTDRAQ